MLHYAVVFFVIALIAAFLGFNGVAALSNTTGLTVESRRKDAKVTPSHAPDSAAGLRLASDREPPAN